MQRDIAQSQYSSAEAHSIYYFRATCSVHHIIWSRTLATVKYSVPTV